MIGVRRFQMIRVVLILGLAGSVMLVYNACTNSYNLVPLDQIKMSSLETTKTQLNFCTDPAFFPKQYLKTIIVLDHSGSNNENYQMDPNTGDPVLIGGTVVGDPLLGTDPTGVTRYGTVDANGTLLNYLKNLPANDPMDPTRYFALVDFSSDTYKRIPNSGFTSDISAFFTGVLEDSGQSTIPATKPNDGGATNYLKVLKTVYDLVSNDVALAVKCADPVQAAIIGTCPLPGKVVTSNYVIIFMSDGAPVIKITLGGPTGVDVTRQTEADILAQVRGIAAFSSNTKFVSGVNLFTIYYYHNLPTPNIDPSAQKILANMAVAGNGITYNVTSGSNINYNEFQPPKKKIRYQLADVLVTNRNMTWWTDGKIHLDSDGDGLPDDVEKFWGSDPLNAYSFGNGINDLVKYVITNGAPCTSVSSVTGLCMDAVPNYSAAGQACAGIKMIGTKFFESDPNGLNDCEKTLLSDSKGINSPDSNGDMLPDWLEFKNFIPFQVGSAPGVNLVDQDGYTPYQKIKFSLPLGISTQQVTDAVPSNYDLRLLSSTDSQDCYHLDVRGIPIAGAQNSIQIDLIEKSPMDGSNYLYRKAIKKMAPASQLIQFEDWNDAQEKTLGTWQVWP